MSSAHAVDRREDLGVDDVAARRGASAGDDGEQPGMVGREHGEFGDAAKSVGFERRRDRPPGILGLADKPGVLDLARGSTLSQ